MKKILLGIVLGIALLGIGCTANERAKQFGGTVTVEIPANEKLVNLTWKDSELWILKRTSKEGEVAETYTFKEDSAYGVLEGTVIVRER